jgi:hypothetical protein
MKKLFSEKTLVIVGFTYILIAIAFSIGYSTHKGGFIDFGAGFSGLMFSAMALPIIMAMSLITIIVTSHQDKPGPKVIGYLLLTLGVVAVAAVVYIVARLALST